MNKILPVVLALTGLGLGVGGGLFLRPSPDAAGHATAPMDEHADEASDAHTPTGPATEPTATATATDNAAHPTEGQPEYVKLSNQFVVPIVADGRVASMVVLSLGLEVTAGSTDAIFAMEPKLRDSFLQLLFDHANAGGFRGSFTEGANLMALRRALLESAQQAAGDRVLAVLISDIARQDS